MKAKQFRPMLAGKADLTKQQFPCYASPKLDGIRAIVKDGQLLSRSLKLIPNNALQKRFAVSELEGLDGELIVGDPTADDVYNKTVREVMTIDGEDTACFYVFDKHDVDWDYKTRLMAITAQVTLWNMKYDSRVSIVLQTTATSTLFIDAIEADYIERGYEGLMLRSQLAPYKYGRSTTNEGYLLKLKRFEDSEAVVMGMEELRHNGNEATASEIGLTKRSTHQDNKVPMGTMGALIVTDCNTGVTFNVGTGFTAEQRQEWWDKGIINMPQVIKYKYFPVGVKDKPRHPVFLGFRDRSDM